MPIRKKSKLENFFSINQHRKRFGASKVAEDLETSDLKRLKSRLINIDEISYTHGADKSLAQHLENLKSEFSGQSELLYYHAKLIVLIRRGHETDNQFKKFKQLWGAEGSFLLKELNTRWLVSASDTFADHSDDQLERSLALSISLLVNTIKISETERYMLEAENKEASSDRVETLKKERVSLFDGTSAFAIGTDDTLRNMRWRMDDTSKQSPILGGLLQEIFERLQNNDTVYSRFRKLHTRSKTAWW